MPVGRLIGLAVLAYFLAACDDGASDPPAPPLLEATRDLRIGSVNDPGSLLTFITRMAVGPNGEIYSAHPRESVIRVHGPDGRLKATVGGRGEGPGEFSALGAIGLLGDTLWAFDRSLSRVSYFTRAGELIRTVTVPFRFRESPDEKSPARAAGVLPDGRVLGSEMAWSPEVASGTLTEAAVVAMDTGGTLLDTLYVREPTIWAIQDPDDPSGFGAYGAQPFADNPMFALSVHQSAFVAVRRLVVDETSRNFRVTRVTFAGDTVFDRTFAYDPVPIDPGLPDSLAEAAAEQLAGRGFGQAPALRKAVSLARADLYVPAHYPPVDRVLVGLDETVWLRMGGATGDTAEWLVLDPDGEPAARVHLPRDLHLWVARLDRVWGWITDDLDVPYVVRYRLAPASEGAS